jgi:hypothetical protein
MCKSYKSSSEHRKSFSDAKLIRWENFSLIKDYLR